MTTSEYDKGFGDGHLDGGLDAEDDAIDYCEKCEDREELRRRRNLVPVHRHEDELFIGTAGRFRVIDLRTGTFVRVQYRLPERAEVI